RRERRQTRNPVHPSGLESDEITERRARVEIRTARFGEMTRRFREAENENEDGQREDERRPQRERSEEFVRLRRKEEDAAADDRIDRQGDEAPEAYGAYEFLGRLLNHSSGGNRVLSTHDLVRSRP